jgi:hypothetical protein
MTKITHWYGLYKGMGFTIKCREQSELAQSFGMPKDAWTFYLNFHAEAFAPEVWTRLNPDPEIKNTEFFRTWYDYKYERHVLADLPWHCGPTFYERVFNQGGEVIGITMGCDYQHLWDDGIEYCLEDIECDVKNCIDAFWELLPETKVKCQCWGGWYPVSEGEFDSEGYFRSFEGKAKIEAQYGKSQESAEDETT